MLNDEKLQEAITAFETQFETKLDGSKLSMAKWFYVVGQMNLIEERLGSIIHG